MSASGGLRMYGGPGRKHQMGTSIAESRDVFLVHLRGRFIMFKGFCSISIRTWGISDSILISMEELHEY